MYQKRKYRYEKDAFGKKHRKYFLENIFGVDVFDMKTFRALKLKLSRDYVTFFRSLGDLYKRGEFKRITNESVLLALETINLLENLIESGTFNKNDVNLLVENVDKLNSRRDILLEKSNQVQALKDRMNRVRNETGIDPKNLNITREIIRKGARGEMKKKKEGVFPFLKRTAPRTVETIRDVFGGVATGLLGPLTPFAEMGKDIFGVGKGIFQKLGERKEERLGRLLSPLSPQGSVGGAFGGSPGIMAGGATSSASRRAGSNVLLDFFNRGAYKAKWTKELLKRMKGFGTAKSGFSFGGILSGVVEKFKDLSLSLVPLIGPAGKLMLLAGAIAFASDRIYTLMGKFEEWRKTKEDVEKEIEKYKKIQKEQEGRLQSALGKKLQKGAKGDESSRVDALKMIHSVEMERAKKVEEESLTWGERLVSPLTKPFYKEPRKTFWPQAEEKSRVFPSVPEFFQRQGKGKQEIEQELLRAIKKLDETALGLHKGVDRMNRKQQMGEPGLGNPYDSSDPWVNALASSELELED